MLMGLYINLIITGICVLLIGVYFNLREKKIHKLASSKIKELQDKYAKIVTEKRQIESAELQKLKNIANELEEEYKNIRVTKRTLSAAEERNKNIVDTTEFKQILHDAKIKAAQIVRDAKINAEEEAEDYLEHKKREIETKIVDLVIAITKKILSGGLSYDQHKKAIEDAFMEMEGKLK